MAAAGPSGGLQFNSQPVRLAVGTLGTGEDAYVQKVAQVGDMVGDIAAHLSAAGETDKVEALRKALLELVGVGKGVELHSAALGALGGGYVMSAQTTDFGALLEQEVARRQEALRYDATKDRVYVQFQDAVGGEGQGGDAEQEGERIDDDIVIEAGGGTLAPNLACPVSGVPILELRDPVTDAQGYVYERKDVLKFLQNKPGQRARIVAGTNHYVTIGELKVAERVVREIRKLRRRPMQGTQQQQQKANVVDV